jgi:hypothetical protein
MIEATSSPVREERKRVHELIQEFRKLVTEKGKRSREVESYLKANEAREGFYDLAMLMLDLEPDSIDQPEGGHTKFDTYLKRVLCATVVVLMVLVGGALWLYRTQQQKMEALDQLAKVEAAKNKLLQDKHKTVFDLAADDSLRKGIREIESARQATGTGEFVLIRMNAEEQKKFIAAYDRVIQSFDSEFVYLLAEKGDEDSVAAATFALARISLKEEQQKKAIPVLKIAIQTESIHVRRDAHRALAKNKEAAMQVAVEMWESKHRGDVIEVLGHISKESKDGLSDSWVSKICQEIPDKGKYRVEAAKLLTELKSEQLTRVIIQEKGKPISLASLAINTAKQDSEDLKVRLYCIVALSNAKGNEAQEALRTLFDLLSSKGSDPAVGFKAEEALLKWKDVSADSISMILSKSEQPDTKTLSVLFRMLGRIGASPDIKEPEKIRIREALVASLKKGERVSQYPEIAFALGELKDGDATVVEALREKLRCDYSFFARQNAILAIGKVYRKNVDFRAVRELEDTFNNERDFGLKFAANSALRSITDHVKPRESFDDYRLSTEDSEVKMDGKGFHYREFTSRFLKDRLYRLDLISKEFDAYLYLTLPDGKVLKDDDSAGDLNSRIYFIPMEDMDCTIKATTFRPGMTGKYRLTVWEFPTSSK